MDLLPRVNCDAKQDIFHYPCMIFQFQEINMTMAEKSVELTFNRNTLCRVSKGKNVHNPFFSIQKVKTSFVRDFRTVSLRTQIAKALLRGRSRATLLPHSQV